MREKLLSLIGKIGRDAKIPRTTSQVGIAIFRQKLGQFENICCFLSVDHMK